MVFEAVERRGTGCSKWDGIESKFGSTDILPLWVADMDIPAPQAAQDAILDRAKHPVYGYPIYTDGFYESIVGWYAKAYEWQIDRDWIVAEHGVVISLNLAIEAFTQEGDGIIIQTPIYPPFASAVKRHNRITLENRLIFKDGKTSIDFEDFEEKAKKAKIFLLCSPHNPSTRAWNRDELEKMVRICHENGVLIISDEIHSDMVFSDRHIPIATLPNAIDITLTLHAPSKTFNIAGLNTSFLVIPNQELRHEYKKAHDRAGLSSANDFGVVALEAVYRNADQWLRELKEYIFTNSEYVKHFIEKNIPQITVYEHQATFLMWLDCKALGLDDEELLDFFVNTAKLGLNSGISFGQAGSGFMRLNIGTSKEILEIALGRLETAVSGLITA